jgi:methyl-accepting chemotaxis protein
MKFLKHMSVGTQLTATFLILAAVIFALAACSYYEVSTVDSYVFAIYNDNLLPLETAATMNDRLHQSEIWMYEYLLTPSKRKTLRLWIDNELAEFAADIETMRVTAMTADEVEALRKIEGRWGFFEDEYRTLLNHIDENEGATSLTALSQYSSALSVAKDELNAAIYTLHDLQLQLAEQTLNESNARRNETIVLLIAVTAGAVLLALSFGFVLGRRIAGNLSKVTKAATALAAGDLSQRVEVTTGDEIEQLATAFNTMADNLQARVETERRAKETLQLAVSSYIAFADRVAHGDLRVRLDETFDGELALLAEQLNGMVASLAELAAELRNGTQSISASATEIFATVSEHTASANQQSAAINQVTATISEALVSSQQVVDKSDNVAQLAQDAVRVGQDGAESVDAILQGMQEIRSKVEDIAQNILSLSEQTQQIGDIISTVTDIADQSNILAINAAIEAAKAGEQGKGFAVVAGEVRNLAEQSKQATAKVRTILVDIQKATNAAVLVTEQGTRGVESGITLAQRAGGVISQLTGAINNASQSALQISAASRQQSLAMEQIAQAMREINQATMQFVVGARQSQSAAEGLTGLAQQLQTLAARYQV